MASDASSGGGPLTEIFGELRAPEPVPYHPVHARVLTIGDPEGATMALAVWEDPGGAGPLHHALRARIEAALLAALSQPAGARNEATWRWLRLAFFDRVAGDVPAALQAFAFAPATSRGGGWRRVMAHLRNEQHAVDRDDLPDDPLETWQVPIALPEGEVGERLLEWDRTLASQVGEDEVWGARPGEPFRRLVALLRESGMGTIQPSLEGLDAIERALVQTRPGIIRWIPPLVFQALCDAVAVVAQVALGRTVEWAASEPDEGGLAPPPLVRVRRTDGEHDHIPIGLAVLRWCVMPLQPGEQPDPLGAWLAHQFRG